MAIDLHAILLERFANASKAYADDLSAMTHEQLSTCVAGRARIAYDFTSEVACINRRFAKRLRGEAPDPLPEGWIVAPDGFRAKEAAIAEIRASAAELVEAWNELAQDELDSVIPLQNGASTFPADLMALATYHCGYHDAQLNYIQALHGDLEMHWSD
jgi:hypothetical protein